MPRDTQSVQFTSDHKILCREIKEGIPLTSYNMPFDSQYCVYCNEIIESESADGITYSSSNNITCKSIEEDIDNQTYSATEYIQSFIPEIDIIETDMGNEFIITNFNQLLKKTNTTVDDWIPGIMFIHPREGRHGQRGKTHRKVRTAWFYNSYLEFKSNQNDGGELISAFVTLNANGVLNNSSYFTGVYSFGNINDFHDEDTNNDNSYIPPFLDGVYIGVRLTHSGYDYATYRSCYSRQCYKNGLGSSNIQWYNTKDILRNLPHFKKQF